MLAEISVTKSSCIAFDTTPRTPPEVLYHGTQEDVYFETICIQGLRRMRRHHVHLSDSVETAKKVAGRRSGKSVILTIFAKRMHDHGLIFFLSDNGVWLTEKVPSEYIELP